MESFTIGIAEESGVDRLSEGVRVGLPFAPGVLAEPYAVALLSSGGESLDAQYHPLALWRDGSIRWLLASFQIDLAAGCETTVEVRPAPPDARMAPTPSLATNEGPRIQVDTGSIRAVVGGESADSFVVEDREGNQLLSAAPHLRITTGDGVLHRADAPDTLELEENGPVCASAFVAGPMRAGAGDSPFRYETRLFFWRGQASVSAEHTFVNVGTEEIVEIDEATIELCADSPFEGTVDCGTAGGVASHVAGSLDDVGIVTVDQRCYFWQEVCRNEDGTPDYYVLDADFGYAVTAGGNEVARGGKAPGWVLGSSAGSTVGVAVRDFWQHGPKMLAVSADGGMEVSLVPQWERDPSSLRPVFDPVEKWVPTFGRGANTRENLRADLQTHDYTGPPRHAPVRFGRTRAITHDILYDFGRAEGDDDARLRLSAYGAPLVPVVDIPYLCETQAMKWITPADRERWPHYEHGLSRGFARYQSEAREYGLLHWGDIKLAYGNYATAPGSYANHEYDTVHGLLVQFARAGDRDCHRCAREAARHIADVDVDQVHGGGRMHGYVQSGEHHEECYTGGTLDHAYVEGLLEHYCFTGDRRSLRAFRRIAESCKKIPDVVAERGIAGIDCRTIGRSCIALLAAYDITGLDEYLAPVRTVVDELVEYAGHPAAGLKGSTGWRPWLGEGEHMAEHIHELLARYHYHTGDSAALRTLRTAIDYSIATWDPETERSFGRPDRIGHPPTRNVPPTPQPEPGEAMVSNEFSLAYLASQTGEPIYLRPVVAGMKNYGRGLEHAVGNRDFPHVRLLSAHFIALMAAIDVDRDELARRALLPALAVPLMGDLTCRTGEGDSEATVHGSVDFVDSIFDRPVLQTGKTSWVSFDAPEDILEHPGAVSLWVSQDLDLKSAIDMGPSPRGLVHIADTGSLTNALDVHLTYNEMWVRLYDHRGWLTSCLQVPVPDWRPGEWHHVAAVWNRFTLTAYVDGRRMAQQPSWLPRGGQRTVHVGWRPLNWFAASRFCILRLFRSPLPGYQVEAIYEEECPYSRQEREQMAHYRDEGTWKLARGGGVSIVEGCPVLAADLGAPPAQ